MWLPLVFCLKWVRASWTTCRIKAGSFSCSSAGTQTLIGAESSNVTLTFLSGPRPPFVCCGNVPWRPNRVLKSHNIHANTNFLWFNRVQHHLWQIYSDHAEDVLWTPAAAEQPANPLILVSHVAEPPLCVFCVSLNQQQLVGILLTGSLHQHVHLLYLCNCLMLGYAGNLKKKKKERIKESAWFPKLGVLWEGDHVRSSPEFPVITSR